MKEHLYPKNYFKSYIAKHKEIATGDFWHIASLFVGLKQYMLQTVNSTSEGSTLQESLNKTVMEVCVCPYNFAT